MTQQSIHQVVVDTNLTSGAEATRSQAILEEYEKFVPWYLDPWHGARVLLAAAIGLGLGYLLGEHQVFFYSAVALAVAGIAAYATLYLSVIRRTRRLVDRTAGVLGCAQPLCGGQPTALEADQGGVADGGA
jgi:hypothetical protein